MQRYRINILWKWEPGVKREKVHPQILVLILVICIKEWLLPKLTLGLNLSNLGPKVSFIDPDQADPQPTNLTIGLNYALLDGEFNKMNIVYDVDKLLVSSYPDMDWDGNGYIGGFDEDGNLSPGNDYNKDGKIEIAHTDPIYTSIIHIMVQ